MWRTAVSPSLSHFTLVFAWDTLVLFTSLLFRKLARSWRGELHPSSKPTEFPYKKDQSTVVPHEATSYHQICHRQFQVACASNTRRVLRVVFSDGWQVVENSKLKRTMSHSHGSVQQKIWLFFFRATSRGRALQSNWRIGITRGIVLDRFV